MPGTELQLNLYENAIDSIKHAIEHYTQDTDEARRYKYTILHLAQGVVLLLKERLRREHPNFVFTNVARSSKTVDVDTAISRLEKIAGLDLGYARNIVEELASLRNGIEHYAVDISKQQADSMIGRTMPFLIAFCRDELKKDFPREIGAETWQALLTIETYLASAIRAVEQRLRAEGKISFYCRICQAYTAIERSYGETEWEINYSVVSCLVCLHDAFIRTECRECKKETTIEPYPSSVFEYHVTAAGPVQKYGYCTDCVAKLHQEFPNFRLPTFVAEVRRGFQKHDFMTTEQLYALLWNVSLAGPTGRAILLEELYKKGVIDFADDHDREEYLATREIMAVLWPGFKQHACFRWSLETDMRP